ncbi:MAG: phage tail sheath subtilisin-like domain-containing protein [Bacteroidales bacterium]|nr:phage tail sheath subtilisin-like domain-containing protein [Bacteroidales bacterium]
MPVQTSYPGVYVQEVPSGVRTITGVATSITLFIGRTSQGPLNEPVLCLNPTDFERTFGNDTSYGDMPRSIRLFFQNGGTQCYVMRIANGAVSASVKLCNEDQVAVMTVKAKSEGTLGDSIRLAVTYNGEHPESTFDLEVFRWDTNSGGQQVKADQEIWQNLSMDPQNSRYAPVYIEQNSNLIEITDLNAATIPSTSSAGRLTPNSTSSLFSPTWQGIFVTGISPVSYLSQWNGDKTITSGGLFSGTTAKLFNFTIQGTDGDDLKVGDVEIDIEWSNGSSNGSFTIPDTITGNHEVDIGDDGLKLTFTFDETLRQGDSFMVFAHPPAYKLRMSNDGGHTWYEVAFQVIDTGSVSNLEDSIISAINDHIPSGGGISATLQSGPTGYHYLQFESTSGDIRISSATNNDLARVLMLGSANGGIEISRYANRRPAPTGISFDLDYLNDFAGLGNDAFDILTVDGEAIDLSTQLVTTNIDSNNLMFLDSNYGGPSGGYDGVREKLAILADAINDYQVNNPDFNWSATVSGCRLFLNLQQGGDSMRGILSTSATSGGSGTDISSYFHDNVRFYSCGTTGTGNYQEIGDAGNDGNAPTLSDFQDAFEIIDREVDLFNIMVLPSDAEHDEATISSIWGPASVFCQQRRAFLIIDPPQSWTDVQQATHTTTGVNSLRIGLIKDHSAVFYPRLLMRENGLNIKVDPGGAIAGLMSRIDGNRGVWKAPAGTEADIRDVVGLEYSFSDMENGVLNPKGINTLRIFPNGIVNWGARTMDGDDSFASEWKYIPVRRLALYMEESLYRGLKWVVFEPNDEPLWAQIRLNVGAFMHNLFRQGAFQGTTPKEAFFVKCDKETTTQNDIDLGRVNIWVGFAPLKPAEFVIIYIQQIAGQIQT